MANTNADRFKKGQKVKNAFGKTETVSHTKHPMVYTKEKPESGPNGGYHHTKVWAVEKSSMPNMTKLKKMLQLEIAATAAYNALSDNEKKAYNKAISK
jgi:hypothetical protein